MTGLSIPSVDASFNPTNVGRSDAISLRKNALPLRAGQNIRNVLGGKSAIPVRQTAFGSVFLGCVGVVVGFCADAKMVWVHARRVVARVHDDHPVRDRPLKSLIRVPVRPHRFAAGKHKDAVPVAVFGSLPNPARIGFFQSVHEDIFGSKDGVFAEFSLSVKGGVATSAKLASNSPPVWVIDAIRRIFRLIGHWWAPSGTHYIALSMEHANVI